MGSRREEGGGGGGGGGEEEEEEEEEEISLAGGCIGSICPSATEVAFKFETEIEVEGNFVMKLEITKLANEGATAWVRIN